MQLPRRRYYQYLAAPLAGYKATRRLMIDGDTALSWQSSFVSLGAVDRTRHSFRLIQMPGNLLEITGLSAAPAMRQAGLHVSLMAWLPFMAL